MDERVYTGRGVGVAVLDTGIFSHIDFRGRLWAFYDFVGHKKSPYDDNGHGTHVAGILAGDGKASGGRVRGMAPDCGIIALKVLDGKGNGNRQDLLQAFRWIEENRRRYRIRVVNISAGTTGISRAENQEMLDAADRLWREGLVIVAAAGNYGPKPGSITAPGSSKRIITVGSSDMLVGKNGVSGRGPTGECVCKPDIVAPGRRILSCLPGGGYGRKSGTSMSTPVVSGGIACALEKDPGLTGREIKQLLKLSATDMGYPRNVQGWGKFHRDRFLSSVI